MKHILLTGANGYIGKRLLPVLLKSHKVTCIVRDKSRFNNVHVAHPNCNVVQFDFLKMGESEQLPKDIDGAYYLMHSMSSKKGDFEELEETIVYNFLTSLKTTNVKHIVYLGGINNDKTAMSKHLKSRSNVEQILSDSEVPCTTLGAGIIIGSGSSSFEIMRDLVEKLPLMIAPKWLLTNSEYIAVSNVRGSI